MLGKTTYSRVIIVTAIVTGAALVIAALIWLMTGSPRPDGSVGIQGAGETVDQRASLPLAGVSALTIEAVDENVSVIEGTGDAVEVWLHGTYRGGGAGEVPKLVTSAAGSAAVAKVQHAPLEIGVHWCDLTLEVRVPRRYAGSVKVTNVSGDIETANHEYSEFELVTTSGEIAVAAVRAKQATIRTVSGDVGADSVNALTASLRTTSGAVRVKSLAARDADISSVSGDVNVESLTGNATAHTTSGEVSLGYAAVPPSVSVVSTSGDVSISLPADAAFTLDARSTSGDISCVFPITIEGRRSGQGEHALAGTVGGSGNKLVGAEASMIRIETTSGEIQIKR
jgi:DUF4097 and DUF4098 domain-containing protein YvlB